MDKPTVTLDFEPIESKLSGWSRFSRHANSEHYRPVVAGGGVMLARALEKLNLIIIQSLKFADADQSARSAFIQ